MSLIVVSISSSSQVSNVLGCLIDHSNHFSYSQSAVQPFVLEGGSHSTKPLLMPSPHFSVQELFLVGDPPVQINPSSWMHKFDHPSPSTWLPSSQPSCDILRPSPHTGVQLDVLLVSEVSGHLYPGSIFQFALQPSPGRVLPSSQLSGSSSGIPSPHTFFQTSGESTAWLYRTVFGSAIGINRVTIITLFSFYSDSICSYWFTSIRSSGSASITFPSFF